MSTPRLGSSASTRVSGEKKYYLANLPAWMDLRSQAATIKERWVPASRPINN